MMKTRGARKSGIKIAMQTGPKGGKFYINAAGHKVYPPHVTPGARIEADVGEGTPDWQGATVRSLPKKLTPDAMVKLKFDDGEEGEAPMSGMRTPLHEARARGKELLDHADNSKPAVTWEDRHKLYWENDTHEGPLGYTSPKVKCPTLPADEKAAIHDFTGCGYSEIRRASQGDSTNLHSIARAKAVENAIDRHEKPVAGVVSRGYSGLSRGQLEEFVGQHVHHDRTIASTSRDPDQSYEFAESKLHSGFSNRFGVIIEMRGAKGLGVEDLGIKREREVLISGRQSFAIKNVMRHPKHSRIYIVEVEAVT